MSNHHSESLDAAAQHDAAGAADPLLGSTLAGRYEVVRRIGEGGMGFVYEGRHAIIEKPVAIKVLRDDVSGKPDVVERFRQEAKSASRIGHENIIDISDFGVTPSGQNFFVMELLNGEDLANVLARETTIETGRAVRIVLQCCLALGAAHSKGIVHRDMKPENIFLIHRNGRADFVKIVDFGIAKMTDLESVGGAGARKLTKTGMIFGTPEYMAPEQAAGKPLDHRVDVYALGVILYEMLCGRVPFVGETFMGILTQHLFEQPPPLKQVNPHVDYDPDVEAVLAQAMHKEPDQRFQHMEQFAAALASVPSLQGQLDDMPGDLSHTGIIRLGRAHTLSSLKAPPPARQGKGHWARWGALALGVGALAVGAFYVRGHFTSQGTSERTAVTRLPSQAAPAAAEAPSASAAGPDGTQADPSPAAPKDAKPPAMPVPVQIQSSPAGARIEVVGRSESCDATPCELRFSPGQSLTLVATHGSQRAERSIQTDSAQSVDFDLRAPHKKPSHSARAGRARPSSGARRPPRRRGGGDLKVPDIFR